MHVRPADRDAIAKWFYQLPSSQPQASPPSRGSSGTVTVEELEEFGPRIYNLFFTDKRFRNTLTLLESDQLHIVTNDLGIPWELAFDTTSLNAVGLRHSVSTSFYQDSQDDTGSTRRRSQSVPLEARSPLKILFIVNPTPSQALQARLDLADIEPSVEDELICIQELIRAEGVDAADLVILRGDSAKLPAIASALWKAHETSHPFTMLHFAGHAVFHPDNNDLQGLVLSDKILTPDRAQGLQGLPSVVFLNSCVTAKAPQESAGSLAPSLFRAFCSAGVRAFIGTHWKPTTSVASEFAVSFYAHLLGGQSVGEALRDARNANCRDTADATWASYTLFGDSTLHFRPSNHSRSPFKGLDRYQESDSAMFLGREIEAAEFLDRLSTAKILVLSGKSGAGKSSFIRAAICPILRDAEQRVVIVDATHKNFEKRLRQQLAPFDISTPAGSDRRAQGSDHFQKVNIFIDQSEAFFQTLNQSQRNRKLLQDLLNLSESSFPEIGLVFSIREDRLCLLAGRIPLPAHAYYPLGYLSIDAATRVITEPLSQFGIRISGDLVEEVVDNIAKAESQSDEPTVYPPFLQIACEKLFRSARRKALEGKTPLARISQEI